MIENIDKYTVEQKKYNADSKKYEQSNSYDSRGLRYP